MASGFRLAPRIPQTLVVIWQDGRVRLAVQTVVVLLLATGCKLVELKMPGEPLAKQDFALRGHTREFAKLLSATVEHAADFIASQTADPAIRTHCVQWKIGAVSAVRSATMRSAPKLALLDAWAFCRQMNVFLDQGEGGRLFGPFQSVALTNSQALEQRLAHTARTLLSGAEYSRMESFLVQYAAQFPLRTLAFDREPVGPLWEDLEGKPSPTAPAGTGSEALSDVADRLQMLGEQLPAEVRWRLGLEGDALEAGWARTEATLNRLDAALKQVGEAAAASPAAITNAVLEMRTAFLPAIADFEAQWTNTTHVLQTERQALTATFATERAAVLKELDQQRAAVMKEVDQQRAALMQETRVMLDDMTERSLTHAHKIIRDVLFYLVLLVGMVLGLPFLFGILLGRAWGRAARAKGT